MSGRSPDSIARERRRARSSRSFVGKDGGCETGHPALFVMNPAFELGDSPRHQAIWRHQPTPHLRCLPRRTSSLAESVKWAPRTMAEVHDREHVETECDHTHDVSPEYGGADA